jgi:hypothetical protein
MPRFLQTPSFKLGIPAMLSPEPGNLKKRSKPDEPVSNGSAEPTTKRSPAPSAFQPFSAVAGSSTDTTANEDSNNEEGWGENNISPGQVLRNLKNIYKVVRESSSR